MQRPLLVVDIKAALLWREEWGRLAFPFKSQRYEQAAAAVPGAGDARRPAHVSDGFGVAHARCRHLQIEDRGIPKPGSQQHCLVQSCGLAGDRNMSKDSSPAPFQGTTREVLYMHEQERRVQPGTGECLTWALSQSLLSLTFKSFSLLLPEATWGLHRFICFCVAPWG